MFGIILLKNLKLNIKNVPALFSPACVNFYNSSFQGNINTLIASSGLCQNEKDMNNFQERRNPLSTDPELVASPTVNSNLNLASFVNRSEFLHSMVKLGVSIHQWEKKSEIRDWVLGIDIKNVEPIIHFLLNQNIPVTALGSFFTQNPYIFKLKVSELETRTYYLLSKKFDPKMISQIYFKNPYWLQFR